MTVFDIIGPVMIGPSSSHTAGAARIGKFAYNLATNPTVRAEILFHGSFAKTYKGHGSDKAIIGGILGMETDDPNIRNSMELAEKQGLKYTITTGTIPDTHPNTAKVTLFDKDDNSTSVIGQSIGGGNILITEINGLELEISGGHDTLIVVHKDTPGVVAAVTKFISEKGVNVFNIHLSREEKGGTAILSLEADGNIDPELAPHITELPNIFSTTMIPRL